MSGVVSRDALDSSVLRRWASSLGGPVILPGDIAYEDARRVWNLAVDRRPAAIVRCATVEDVVRTIEFARTHGAPLAVRSGGHSQAGHGVCEGGVVVDLSSLRAIEADVPHCVVRVAAGARVADVMDATQAHGLVTPMGGCPDVGVGGLTLGGGENFLMARHGVVCDNLLAAQVVTADGRVLTASAAEHEDLFWALRGGGGNFGIVTRFEYRLHAVGDVLSGQWLFPLSRARDTMRRYRDLMRSVPDEFETSGGLTSLPDGPAFFIAICFCGDRAAGEEIVGRWQSALQPAEDTVKWSTYSADLVVPAAASTGTGLFLPDLHDDVVDIFTAALSDAPPSAAAVWNDFHGAVTRVPREAMAFPLRDRGFDMFISVPWEDADTHRSATAWLRRLSESLRPFGRGVYVNNLNDEESDRVSEAYGPNYPRLAAVKAAYDPTNLFRINHNVTPQG